MAKRFVVPAITTVLVLIVALTMWKGYQDSLYTSFLASLTGESGDGGLLPGQPKQPPWERVAQRYPNDWRVQHAWADMAPNAKESIARYNKVIARFSDKAALYAGRVIRYAQIISYGRPEEHWLSGDEAPTNLQKANVPDVERAIAVIREGMKVEPDNAFFNYALAGYLFALRRDEEALAQVAEGARKPRYDSHVRDTGLNRIHLDKLTQDAPLARVVLMVSVLLPHCAKERQVARLVTWYAKEAEKKGDHALALERYGQVMRMGAQIRESAGFIIEALVGVAIEAIGRGRGVKRERPPVGLIGDALKQWQARRQRQIAQEFADYANAHGRSDLAAAAWRSMEEGQETRKIAQWFVGSDRKRGVEEPYAGLARYLRIFIGQVVLEAQAGLAFLMALITALLARRFREKQQVSWLTAFCVAFVCWLPAAVLLYVNCQRVPNPWGWQAIDGPFSPLLLIVAIFLPFVLEDLCWGARVVWMRLRPKGTWRFDSPPLLPRTCIMLMLLSLFTYVVLLAPLKKAANDANAYTEKMAAGEMRLARETWEKAEQGK